MTDSLPAHDLPSGILDLLESSKIALTIADAAVDDLPIIAANQPFYDLCGYEPDEVLGRNCRFLQPAGGGGPVRKRLRDLLTDPGKNDGRFALANERKDGTAFLNLVYITKLRENGAVRYFLGSQFDAGRFEPDADRYYREALSSDLRKLGQIGGEMGLVMLGNYDTLASSHALIAQAKLDD
ncbi:PAS domain-containing protein [Altererythrobacter luteolus]|uniref:PAS domain-containing protein n=1 Tax=Pontixanthobacter luteolus TaxID=295089 RepID=A0A6I4V4K6_9SPHN|nr:PAS domain-containing protein [Pontixanthobacter luteolus]MXP48301.1 PAS domain-containing protein [Pontixanthobacter luteolus]